VTQADTYTIRVTSRPNGIRVEVDGEANYENTLAYWRVIITHVQARKPKTVLLIDKMRDEHLSAEQWQSLVNAMIGHGLESTPIAHVKPYGLQLVEHCEIFAQEAGFDARVFDDERQADLWLRHGER
jgi:hypothetical protein